MTSSYFSMFGTKLHSHVNQQTKLEMQCSAGYNASSNKTECEIHHVMYRYKKRGNKAPAN